MTSKVFLSYRHEDDVHKARVHELAKQLDNAGLKVVLDQFSQEREFNGGGPNEGWPRWSINQANDPAHKILIIASDGWFRCFEGTNTAGESLGAAAEAGTISMRLVNAGPNNADIRVVTFTHIDIAALPIQLQPYHVFELPRDFHDLCRWLKGTTPPQPDPPEFVQEVFLDRLQTPTGEGFFDRTDECNHLLEVWPKKPSHIVVFTSMGGMGKTALVHKWLNEIQSIDYLGAHRVYGWSFYSGKSEESRPTNGDEFLTHALGWFGDPAADPGTGVSRPKGERLAELIQDANNQRTLLVLDGLEAIQDGVGRSQGRLMNDGVAALLKALARLASPWGLCVITTRVKIADLSEFATVEHRDLEKLDRKTSLDLLRHLKVKGPTAQIHAKIKPYRGHALALRLFGHYVSVVYNGDIRKCPPNPPLVDTESEAFSMLHLYEEFLRNAPAELQLLRLFGLFNRPAKMADIEVLRIPPISGLTDAISSLPEEKWKSVMKHLRNIELINVAPNGDTFDCHPLIHEYFARRLKQVTSPDSYREAHARLFRHFQTAVKYHPNTREEMEPLFRSVIHGCHAGRHGEALDQVYWPRIVRSTRLFRDRPVGASCDFIPCLEAFWDKPWKQLSPNLNRRQRAMVLDESGHYLFVLGHLPKAQAVLPDACEAWCQEGDVGRAAFVARLVRETFLLSADFDSARTWANKSVELAAASVGSQPPADEDADRELTEGAGLAQVLHYCGSKDEARAAFQNLEQKGRKTHPAFSTLTSFRGIWFCDLLLDDVETVVREHRQGDRPASVETMRNQLDFIRVRAEHILHVARSKHRMLDASLARIIIAKTHLLEASGIGGNEDVVWQSEFCDAIQDLKNAGHQHDLVRSLLAQGSSLYRHDALGKTPWDPLEEARDIAMASGMELYLADYYLEAVRWYLREKRPKRAKENLALVKAIIQRGYGRRQKELEDLEDHLEAY